MADFVQVLPEMYFKAATVFSCPLSPAVHREEVVKAAELVRARVSQVGLACKTPPMVGRASFISHRRELLTRPNALA